jgi:hypothetical protein
MRSTWRSEGHGRRGGIGNESDPRFRFVSESSACGALLYGFEAGHSNLTHGMIDPVRYEPVPDNFDLMDAVVFAGCFKVTVQGRLSGQPVKEVFYQPPLRTSRAAQRVVK